MRKAILWALVAGGAAAAVARRRRGTREHVDLHFRDGSMISFEAESEGAAELFAQARHILAAARG